MVSSLSGQVPILDGPDGLAGLDKTDIKTQTQQTLDKIDDLLAQAGTSKSKIIEGRIWLKDIETNFGPMNEVWSAWVDPDNKPTRYCVDGLMALPGILVEIQVTAAE